MTNELSTQTDFSILKDQAIIALKSGLLPRGIDTPEKAITIALKGKELGLTPMNAFSHIHVIQGKPTISAELMLSLIYKNCPGAIVNYVETTNQKCVINAKRPGHTFAQFSYTLDEARQAQLLNKDSWKNYPSAMLRARTVSIVARAVFPDAIMGCSYIHEELGADVNEDGEIVDVKQTHAPQSDQSTVVAYETLQAKKELAFEIKKIAEKLNMDNAALSALAMEIAGHPAKEMNVDEMHAMLENMQVQLGSRKTP